MIAFKGQKFSVRVEKVKIPGRPTIEFQSVVKSPGTAVIPLIDKDTILINYQYRPAVKKWIYEFPGGKIEEDETPRDNALKELEEELGYKAGKLKFLARVYPAPYITNDVQHLFLATGLKKTKQRRERGEVIKLRRLTITRALKMWQTGQITDATTIVGLFWLSQRRERH